MNAPRPLPTVSVVIPVFNGASFLAGAVANVRAQTHPPEQIIVVDDGSTDATRQIAQTLGPGIEFVSQENRGPAAARNRGLALVRGDYVGFLDVDDQWPDDNLAAQLQSFASHPEAEIVLGQTRQIVEAGGAATLRRAAPDGTSAPPHLFLIGAALFRRTAFARVGGFDEEKRFSEDLDWFIRAKELHVGIQLLLRPTLIKRCHPQNMTRGKSNDEMGLAAVVRASLARRRQAGAAVTPPPKHRP